ncbi:methylated-DNA--[protein]-cysteine S-methyltransferase [Nocardia blacklockiae]|uniref:methylated-DNA--[protein]-cysteine S-methyltransferase n=1 Tax=Nocardia blacklockiae TaxID=480036 RepID=UPI001893AAF8|nr:methylated-DNA--[protein]-cysteine S-methyltransferase [Nocardia blacklockiae]MBF6171787.1 methylated-DNA--[protein]-cysteine S-methyltransferase [Nocardia blacklockiae]
MSVYTTIDSPVGALLLVGEPAETGVVLTAVSMGGGKGVVVREDWVDDAAAFEAVAAQLTEYFDGRRTTFDIEFDGGGSEFQRRVWRALAEIPYGTTATYGEIAERAGAPRAAVRAVGAAIGANPLLIIRPCHRVIGANGALTGYAGGVERKQRLLELERTRRAA